MNRKKEKIEWRRDKVHQLLVMGYNHYEIANMLQIGRSTISRDAEYLSQQSKENVIKYLDQRLPEEYESPYGSNNNPKRSMDCCA
jgi:transposase